MRDQEKVVRVGASEHVFVCRKVRLGVSREPRMPLEDCSGLLVVEGWTGMLLTCLPLRHVFLVCESAASLTLQRFRD